MPRVHRLLDLPHITGKPRHAQQAAGFIQLACQLTDITLQLLAKIFMQPGIQITTTGAHHQAFQWG
jgi:hypothetical protein